jgi:hypothetical protein
VCRKAGQVDYSYTRPSRRTGGGNMAMPSLRSPQPRVAVVFDTSGSMGEADLRAAAAEVHGVSKQLGIRGTDLMMVQVDAAVAAIVPVFDILAGAFVATVALMVIVPLWPAASAPRFQVRVAPLVEDGDGLADTNVRPVGSVSATTEPAGTAKVLLFLQVSVYWMFAPTAAVAGPVLVIWRSG